MAFKRLRENKTLATNLNGFIESQLYLVRQQQVRQNLAAESRFIESVLSDNLTIEQQIEWRKDQLKKTPKADREEVSRIKQQISYLKDQKEQKDFTDEYVAQVTEMNAGLASVDATITWLRDRLANTTDQSIQTEIRQEISKLSSIKFENQKTMVANGTTFANNSKEISVIDSQIENVKSEKIKAIDAGLDEYVSVLDLQLQSLSKTRNEANIQNSLLKFSLGTATGQSALSLLNAFNDELSKADSTTPVTIGGTRYDSAKQYWEAERANYLNDRSGNGFFGRYQTELQEQVNLKDSNKTLSNSTLTEVEGWYKFIKDRPELAGYQSRIEVDLQKSLQETSDKRAQQILNNFATDLNAGKALSELAYIQDQFNVDQTLNYQKIVTSAAKEKEAQVREILSTMSQLLSKNPGMTNQQALETAVKSGAGVVLTPEQLATSKASDIIPQLGETATKQQFGEGSPVDISPNQTKSFTPISAMQEGDLVKSKTSNTVYLMQGGQLKPFTGNFSEEEFKQVTGGRGWSSVKTLDNIAGVPVGSAITKNDTVPTPTPPVPIGTPPPAPLTPQPAPATPQTNTNPKPKVQPNPSNPWFGIPAEVSKTLTTQQQAIDYWKT